MLLRFSSLIACLMLSGCSTIYVGNVPFTSVEVCSQELASRLHRTRGCLPPTRAENAQGFFLARYRMQLSPAEAKFVEESNAPVDGLTNHLPSWLGRVFSLNVEKGADGSLAIQVPSSGNINFLPLGKEGSRPETRIKTERQVHTELTGAVQKKLNVGAELNPSEIVEKAIGLAALPEGALPPGLKSVLLGQVLQAGFDRQSTDASKGTYYYMSMASETLDSLTSALALCNWQLDVSPGHQTADFISATTTPGEAIKIPSPTKRESRNCKTEILDHQPTISSSITNLLSDLQTAARSRPDLNVVGVVIGIAILQTTRGHSEMCSKAEVGLIAAKGLKNKLSTSNCEDLRQSLDKFNGVRPAVVVNGATEGGTPLNDEEKAQLLLSLQAQYSRAVYKTLEVGSHTSVLAIHWLPVQLPANR